MLFLDKFSISVGKWMVWCFCMGFKRGFFMWVDIVLCFNLWFGLWSKKVRVSFYIIDF